MFREISKEKIVSIFLYKSQVLLVDISQPLEFYHRKKVSKINNDYNVVFYSSFEKSF